MMLNKFNQPNKRLYSFITEHNAKYRKPEKEQPGQQDKLKKEIKQKQKVNSSSEYHITVPLLCGSTH